MACSSNQSNKGLIYISGRYQRLSQHKTRQRLKYQRHSDRAHGGRWQGKPDVRLHPLTNVEVEQPVSLTPTPLVDPLNPSG